MYISEPNVQNYYLSIQIIEYRKLHSVHLLSKIWLLHTDSGVCTQNFKSTKLLKVRHICILNLHIYNHLCCSSLCIVFCNVPQGLHSVREPSRIQQCCHWLLLLILRWADLDWTLNKQVHKTHKCTLLNIDE